MTDQREIESAELSPTLIGRDSPLASLRSRMEKALEGRGSVGIVAGEVGVGKTRLMAEVEREAGERGMRYLRGAGDPTQPGLAYGLFIGVLTAYLRDAAPPEQHALQETIEELAPHLQEVLFPRTPRRLEFPVTELDPDLRQTLFLARLARLLLELAQQQPAVVCFEDLHWADSASLQALRYLVTRNGDAPLMLVATYRLEEVQAAAEAERAVDLEEVLAVVQSNPHGYELHLERLSPIETKLLVSSCFAVSGFGHQLQELLYGKTEGLPLFVVQYLEFLRDEGIVYERQGLWMDRPIRGLEVPESIAAAVQERIKRLSNQEREILSYAAVQGEAFASELVAEALGRPHAEVQRLLEHLARTSHLVQHHEGAFRFAHFFLLNACYTHIPDEQRRAIHRRLATCLQQHRPAAVERVAYHFYRAAALTQALPYLVEAAQRARQNFAYWEAHCFLHQALEALEQVEVSARRPQRLEILLTLAEVDERLGEVDRAGAYCQEVLKIAVPGEDPQAVGQALLQLGWVHFRKGAWEESLARYGEALDLFADLGDAENCATVSLRLGNIAFQRSQLDEAATHFNEAKETALRGDNPALLGGIYGNLGVLSSVRGHYAVAIVNYTKAQRVYQRANHRYGLSQTYQNLGMTYAAQQAWEQALACYAEGEKLAREMGTVDVLANILVSRVAAQIGLGALQDAEASCRGAQIYYQQLQDLLGLAECEKMAGVIGRERAQYAEAETRLRHGKQRFQDLENQLGIAECDLELGLVQQALGDVAGARRYLQASSELFQQIGAEEEVQKAQALLNALAS